MPTITLPPHLAALQAQAGKHRKGRKILVYGEAKTGKSFFAATAPKPILALACGEPGIVPYLTAKDGDIGLEIYNGEDFYKAVEWGLEHTDDFASLVIDNINLAWALAREGYEEEFGEIKGRMWGTVKKPWHRFLFKAMRSQANVVMTAWTKKTVWGPEEAMPGQQAGLSIKPSDIPNVEEKVNYTPDLIFRTEVLLDSKFRPTPIHTVTFTGGRRPKSVPPTELYTGKVWKFDSRKPVDVWQEVIGPLDAKWMEGAVEHLEIDPEGALLAEREMREAYLATECLRVVEEINACQSPQLAKELWERAWEPVYKELSAERRALVDEAKAKAKARWSVK